MDESVWQAWDVTWISLVTLLLVAAGFRSYITPYDVAFRFLLTACGLVLMFRAFHTRHYAFATGFGELALLYNPVAPAFSFSGEWQGAFVMASAVPFIPSLTWRNAKLVPNA